MNASRRAAVLAAAGLLSLLVNASLSAADRKPQADPAVRWGLAYDGDAGLQLVEAAKYVKDRDWPNAIRLLQRVLDGERNVLTRIAGQNGKPERFVIVFAEAERLLAAMPPEGRALYQRTYGASAAALREAAHQSGDAALLAQLTQRYRYTDAGAEAWREQTRGRKLPQVPKRARADWPLFRGDAERSAEGVGSAPHLMPLWRHSLMHDEQTDNPAPYERLKRALDHVSKDRKQPIIPAFSPLILSVTRKKQQVPLLIYKNYWGLVARELMSGEIAWETRSEWSLEKMLSPRADPKKQHAMQSWLQYYVDQNQHPQVLFENSTVGTLSTDGQFVYVVEDLAVPPQMPQVHMGFNPNVNNGSNYGLEVQDAIAHSRLQAFELKSNGKLKMELGSSDDKTPLSSCYFLAAPLPLDGRLYLLVEKERTLSLACLEAGDSGKLVSLLPLVKMATSLSHEPDRRTQAAHLAYGDGILVCPTNSGLLLGVDLLQNRLLWTHPYREKDEARPQQHFDRLGRPRGFIVGPDGRIMQPGQQNRNQWKASAPVITGDKIVYTPPDATTLRCLSLRDGSLLWSHKKNDEDVYLGGVHDGKVIVVGKTNVQALALATGASLWTVETGLPSGQGIAAGGSYYLPLKESIHSKQPEVCVLDLHKGRIAAHHPSRPNRVGENAAPPGNLLLWGDVVVSLSAQEITVYPQLAATIARLTDALSRNSRDPAGLAERATLRRANGDLAGAIEDLRNALKNKPNDEMRRQARSLLFDALTERYQGHVRDADGNLEEYEELCKDGDAAEQKRRRVIYLLLVAHLREIQGRFLDAMRAYLDLGDLDPGGEPMPAPDEPTVKVSREVWVRGHIVELIKKATPEQRKQMEEELKRRMARKKDRRDT